MMTMEWVISAVTLAQIFLTMLVISAVILLPSVVVAALEVAHTVNLNVQNRTRRRRKPEGVDIHEDHLNLWPHYRPLV
jgi:hypothetical protein